MELKDFGEYIHKDSDYLERERLKKQEIAERYKFDNYDDFRKTVKWLNHYSYYKHKLNTGECIGVAMFDLCNTIENPKIDSYDLENYIGGRFDYMSQKIGKHVDEIHKIERRIKIFFNFDDNYPESKELIRRFLNDEKNISDFVDALVIGNIAEDLMELDISYTMEYHKACGMSLHDQSLSLYNFYNDLYDYVFSNTKDIVEKNFTDTGNIIKFIEDEETKLRMERDLNNCNNELPKQKVFRR